MASGAAPKKLNHPRRRTVRNGARETGLGIPAAPEQSHQCYIIGIDYGATFSAVTYTLVNHDSFLRKTLKRPEPSRVKTLLNYPDQTFSDQVVPTSLVYRVPPDRVAPHLAQQERPSAWGLRSESVRGLSGPGKIKIDLAKLLLTDKETDREPVRVLKRNAKLIRKTGTQLVADFLRKLVEHTSSEIEKEFPARSNSAKYYFCGAPNAWNFAERSRLFSACHAAGIGNVTFVPEAEAAANALLSETQAGDYILKVGEGILIVDAGGMTVDTTVYQLLQLNPIRTKSVTIGQGSSCGGAYCNLRCKQWVMDQFDKKYPPLVCEEMGDLAAEAFEKFKRTVNSKTDPGEESQPDMTVKWDNDLLKKMSEYDETIGGWAYIDPDRITIERDMIRKRFLEPSVRKIRNLVREEMKASPIPIQHVILTGGFAASPYLYTEVRKFVSDNYHIIIQRPNVSGIAVATGLTLMGASGSLNTGSISRFSIGLDEKQSYEESLHGPRDKIHHFADKHTGNTNDRVVESILWLIKRGDVRDPDEPLVFPRDRTIDDVADVSQWSFLEEIICSETAFQDHLDRFDAHMPYSDLTPESEDNYKLRADCFRDDKAGKFRIDLTDLSDLERKKLVVQKRGQSHGTMPYRLILTGDLQNLHLEFIASKNDSVRRTFAINLENEQLSQLEMGSFVASSPVQPRGGGSPTLSPPPEATDDGGASEQDEDQGLSAVQRGKRPTARQQKRRSNFRVSEGESSKRTRYSR